MRFTALLLCFFAIGCKKQDDTKKLVIFHAGSLSLPFKTIAREFEKENKGIKVFLEASGSRICARKISELKRRADIMASADYTVINTLLIPDHARFNIKFAGNEMVIAYSKRVKKNITPLNWHTLLLDPRVSFGRSDPNSDPCGYRSVMVMKLAERHYKLPGLAQKMLAKDTKHIRPKETDLLALLETGVIDFLFIYRSVAVQHGLRHIVLPDEINLKRQRFAHLYSKVDVKISGKTPGSFILKKGAPMVYGVTIPKNAPNRAMAIKFITFLLTREKGLATMDKMGQKPLVPAPSKSFSSIPKSLQQFALPPNAQ